ncbi:ACP S-malonyltransferase [Deinococcus pimensis]|uniref:ACP S-malonyltransferase n=1 Tax=Deinococcus pimensis TaxID=309888 RepID=UPI0004869053|nr:ACP S-malonyltransferase [Deinococcus pimensis]
MTATRVIAALFPGQGSQAVGMGAEIAGAYEVAEAVLAEADATLPGLRRLMTEGPLEELTLTANQQPALVAASTAAYRAWREATGLTPAYAAGHSLGEYSALVASGALDLADALRLVRRRGQLMQDAVPAGQGAMAAVMNADLGTIRAALAEAGGAAEVANLNAPTQTVISGEKDAVARAGAALKSAGARVIPLKVSAPFHCSLMRPARDGLTPDLRAATWRDLGFPVVANVTADVVTDALAVPDLLAEQITGSVRWVESVQKLAELGVTEFVEFGPGTVLRGLVERIHPGAIVRSVHTPADVAAYLDLTQENA